LSAFFWIASFISTTLNNHLATTEKEGLGTFPQSLPTIFMKKLLRAKIIVHIFALLKRV